MNKPRHRLRVNADEMANLTLTGWFCGNGVPSLSENCENLDTQWSVSFFTVKKCVMAGLN